jgi:hypothetical protein
MIISSTISCAGPTEGLPGPGDPPCAPGFPREAGHGVDDGFCQLLAGLNL